MKLNGANSTTTNSGRPGAAACQPSHRAWPGGRKAAAPAARAFTLLEMLIAVVAFAIVLAAINTVFYSAIHLRNKTTQAIEDALPIQQALAVIKRDLENLVVPGGPLSGTLQTTPSTTGTSGSQTIGALTGQVGPSFYTSTGIVNDDQPWGEIQKVAYQLVEPTNHVAGRELMRSVTRNLLPVMQEDPVSPQWLMSGLEQVTFTYYDGTQWRDSWDSASQTNLPKAIKVQLQPAIQQTARTVPPPIELVIPLIAEARTNQPSGGGP